MLIAGPGVAIVSIAAALVATGTARLPLRDPDQVAGRRLLLVLALVAVLVGIDVVLRARRRTGTRRPSRAAMRVVWRERWTPRRCLAVGGALVSFYVTYLAYRNLKSVVPLLRPGELFDRQLAELDRSLFAGADPGALLHSLVGTGMATHVLSAAYMLFFVFIPATLAFALVFSTDLEAGIFYATAQSLNWLLGAASYFVLPSLGPVYADPATFASLASSAVTELQDLLIDQREEFLRDPEAGTAQSIGAFASVHVSIFFTGALAAHVLGLDRRVRIAAWVLVGFTVAATIHLGWHYVSDDVAGAALGTTAILLARALTGYGLRTPRRASTPTPAPA